MENINQELEKYRALHDKQKTLNSLINASQRKIKELISSATGKKIEIEVYYDYPPSAYSSYTMTLFRINKNVFSGRLNSIDYGCSERIIFFFDNDVYFNTTLANIKSIKLIE